MAIDPRTQTFVISASGTTSTAIRKGPVELVGALFPAALTGTSVTFTVSRDGTTYVPLYWEGVIVQFTVAASRGLSWDPAKFAGWDYVKIVSGSAEASERTITPVWRDYR